MIKVLDKKNNIIELKYYLLNYYCKKECLKYINESAQNKTEYQDYSKSYNYFKPYFDFVFSKLNYTLFNPLLFEKTTLKNIRLNYYILEKDELFNKNYFDFSLSNDFCIGLHNNCYSLENGFFILEDGTILENRYVERHLKNAKTILNQNLIQDMRVYNLYKKYIKDNPNNYKYNIIDFLTESIGIIYGRINFRNIDLIINNKLLSKNQYETIKKISLRYNVNIEDYNNLNNKILIKK